MSGTPRKDLNEHLRNPFTAKEYDAWMIACRLILELEAAPIVGMRCHEIARAMGRVLKMDVCDGHVGLRFRDPRNPQHFMGGVEHSWLWTVPFPAHGTVQEVDAWPGNILDPWCMASYPRAQLHSARLELANLVVKYHPGEPRTLIDDALTDHLEQFFQEKLVELSKTS